MTVAHELDFETYSPQLYVVPAPSVRTGSSALVRRRRIILATVVVALLVLLALPIRALGGSTLAQAAPAQGQEYIVKAGDTLTSIATRADPARAASLTDQLVRETGTNLVVPGEHIFIP
jgi:Tfp pilus assembly protein FimV